MALHFWQNQAEITAAQKFENSKLYKSSLRQLIETLQKIVKSGVLYTTYLYFGYHWRVSFDSDSEKETSLPN